MTRLEFHPADYSAAISFCTPAMWGERNNMSETHSLAPGLTVEDVQFVSPALAHYTQEAVEGVWKRPQLSPRDRGLITVAALIARSQRWRCRTISRRHWTAA